MDSGEKIEPAKTPPATKVTLPPDQIDLTSSSDSQYFSDSDDDSDEETGGKKSRFSNGENVGSSKKKQKLELLPLGFLDPLPPDQDDVVLLPLPEPVVVRNQVGVKSSNKQFWKAGDFDGCPIGAASSSSTAGMNHVRVHPKFLHSNATSHKWALGAFAELLDNSLDEVVNGATYVNVDMLKSNKEESKMLVIEDNGGGMNPDKMRQCMSLGYSEKSKMANTIGQYGNGFKTSTMRLGADVLVFSRCRGRDGKSPTRSIGLLSYTFLTRTGKEDIVVPMLDYEKEGRGWNKLMRSSPGDWTRNLETIVQWSPFSSEADLLQQFDSMGEQGTRVIIYNLWEDDEGELELDFDSDKHDIQIRGGNRDEKKIEMAQEFPNSRHFLTYRHSLRSYASILYLRLPPQFHMVLRGKDIVHHNIVNDMMLMQEVTYRPQPGADGIPKDSSMYAVVKIGFVKDAASHIDVQGFNVYHKNRLIKPFWRVWNATGSDGRGAIGVLEANFVEPAHDKQGFERTTVLARLEAKLLQMQKLYWSTNCHHIGYAPRRNKKLLNASAARDSSPEYVPRASIRHSSKSASPRWEPKHGNVVFGKGGNEKKTEPVAKQSKMGANRAYNENIHNSDEQLLRLENVELKDSLNTTKESFLREIEYERDRVKMLEALVKNHDPTNVTSVTLNKLQLENRELEDRLRNMEETFSSDLQLERERNKSVEAKIEESKQKIEEMSKEQEALIDIFSEERSRRDNEEENLRKKLKDAANTMQELLDKVLQLEQTKSPNK